MNETDQMVFVVTDSSKASAGLMMNTSGKFTRHTNQPIRTQLRWIRASTATVVSRQALTCVELIKCRMRLELFPGWRVKTWKERRDSVTHPPDTWVLHARAALHQNLPVPPRLRRLPIRIKSRRAKVSPLAFSPKVPSDDWFGEHKDSFLIHSLCTGSECGPLLLAFHGIYVLLVKKKVIN